MELLNKPQGCVVKMFPRESSNDTLSVPQGYAGFQKKAATLVRNITVINVNKTIFFARYIEFYMERVPLRYYVTCKKCT